jgi:hypothetical protein
MLNINTLDFYGGQTNYSFDRLTDECPFCHKSISVRIYQAYKKDNLMEITLGCPDSNCGRIFVSQYERKSKNESLFYYKSSSIGNFVEKSFTEDIVGLSPNFIEIYNQAAKSESLNLFHIAGIGYRKAIEFLIKDYLIDRYPDQEIQFKNKFLGNCIKDDIDNHNLKKVAERATWLGNDETHYVRKWEDKDINDLKMLIELSIRWIEMELLTKKYSTDMK